MHTSSGRWRLGLCLALTTAILWGFLPIGLMLLLHDMDVYTIVWYRFLIAALMLLLLLARTGKLPRLQLLDRNGWLLLTIAIFGLAGNYILYMLGLQRTTPGSAQIMIQLAPVLMLLGSLLIYGETFAAAQWVGLIVLLVGMALFFNRHFSDLYSADSSFYIGIVLLVCAALVWAAYALAQKQLLDVLRSEAIMLCLYGAATLLFFPLAQPATILHLDWPGLALLAFVCLNTLIAYGSFAEALAHWEASRISAVLAITPLVTLVSVLALLAIFPGIIEREPINPFGWLGAILVVCGSIVTSMAGNHEPA